MRTFLILFVIAVTICQSLAADKNLQCYLCSPVTSECEVGKATKENCKGVCSIQTKKGAKDQSMAMRSCVIETPGNKPPCPENYDCKTCDTNLCNSAATPKVAWVTAMGIICAVLYMS